MPEVLVIGAGPAGSTAAILLARAGLSVTLVEQHRFPRDKVCGECLSALGREVIDAIGAADGFQHAGCIPLTRTHVHAADGTCATFTLPRPMWGLSRAALDGLLLGEAQRAGVTLLQPARCERIEGGASPLAVVRDLHANGTCVFNPRVAVVADGKALLSSQSVKTTGDFGIKTHFANVDGPSDAIELFATAGRYGGLAPIEGGRWNAAFSVSAAQLKMARGDVEALFRVLVEGNIALKRRLAGATRVADWFASPLPRFGIKPVWPENVIPVGNAAAVLEPIGGEGMGLALRSAQLAADAVVRALAKSSSIDVASLRREYAKLWRMRRFACRAAAVGVASPMMGTAAVSLADACPSIAVGFLKLVGK